MRTLGLDVHKTFIEVALHEAGSVRRVGRVAIKDLSVFAESLVPTDHVVLESTSVSWAIVDVLAKRAGKVTVSNPMKTRAIASAKVKTDKVDARVLAQLGAADFVAEVWVPDAETRALRRRVAHRAGLVRQRTGLRNQVHGVLARNLAQLPHMSDLFGRRGRRALEEVVYTGHRAVPPVPVDVRRKQVVGKIVTVSDAAKHRPHPARGLLLGVGTFRGGPESR